MHSWRSSRKRIACRVAPLPFAGTVAEILMLENEAVGKMDVADDCATFEGHLYN